MKDGNMKMLQGCPFTGLESVYHSKNQFPLGEKSKRSVSCGATGIYSRAEARGSPFGLPISISMLQVGRGREVFRSSVPILVSRRG